MAGHFSRGRGCACLPIWAAPQSAGPGCNLTPVALSPFRHALAATCRHPRLRCDRECTRCGRTQGRRSLAVRTYLARILSLDSAPFSRMRVAASFRPAYDRIQWNNDEADFAAWCAGQTGYPIVDAAMRQLAQQWMDPQSHAHDRRVVPGERPAC